MTVAVIQLMGHIQDTIGVGTLATRAGDSPPIDRGRDTDKIHTTVNHFILPLTDDLSLCITGDFNKHKK